MIDLQSVDYLMSKGPGTVSHQIKLLSEVSNQNPQKLTQIQDLIKTLTQTYKKHLYNQQYTFQKRNQPENIRILSNLKTFL